MTGRAGAQDAEALFEQLVAEFSVDPAVSPPSGTGGRKFGSSALKVGGKIFAMLTRGELVVKLPRSRVDELVASGTGKPFDAGRGRTMREWVAIAPSESGDSATLAREAREFVAAAPAGGRPRSP